jgi:hypothetical protein
LLRKYDREKNVKLSIKQPEGANGAPAGGSSAVVKQVRELNAQGQRVFGILDRDAILRERRADCLDVFLEPDDSKFREQSIRFFGDTSIWCLTRWEFENYLFCELEVLEKELSSLIGKVRSTRPIATVLHAIFEHADLVLLMVAVNLAIQSRDPSYKRLPHEYGINQIDVTTLSASITKTMDKTFKDLNISVETARAEFEARLSAFMAGEPRGTLSAWLKASRIIDGKMLMARLFDIGHLEKKSVQKRIAQDLGDKINDSDSAIREFIEALDAFAVELRKAVHASTTS